MMNISLTVKEFADRYIPSNTKVRVIKTCNTLFEGTLEELYYSGMDVLNNVVAMIGADEGFICLACRE